MHGDRGGAAPSRARRPAVKPKPKRVPLPDVLRPGGPIHQPTHADLAAVQAARRQRAHAKATSRRVASLIARDQRNGVPGFITADKIRRVPKLRGTEYAGYDPTLHSQVPKGWAGLLPRLIGGLAYDAYGLPGALKTGVLASAHDVGAVETGHPQKATQLYRQIGKPVAHSFGQTVQHPIRQLKEHPDQLVLNALAGISAGAGAAARAGSLSDVARGVEPASEAEAYARLPRVDRQAHEVLASPEDAILAGKLDEPTLRRIAAPSRQLGDVLNQSDHLAENRRIILEHAGRADEGVRAMTKGEKAKALVKALRRPQPKPRRVVVKGERGDEYVVRPGTSKNAAIVQLQHLLDKRATRGLERQLPEGARELPGVSPQAKIGRQLARRREVENAMDLAKVHELEGFGKSRLASAVGTKRGRILPGGKRLSAGEQKAIDIISSGQDAASHYEYHEHARGLAEKGVEGYGKAEHHDEQMALIRAAEGHLTNPSKRLQRAIELARSVSQEGESKIGMEEERALHRIGARSAEIAAGAKGAESPLLELKRLRSDQKELERYVKTSHGREARAISNLIERVETTLEKASKNGKMLERSPELDQLEEDLARTVLNTRSKTKLAQSQIDLTTLRGQLSSHDHLQAQLSILKSRLDELHNSVRGQRARQLLESEEARIERIAEIHHDLIEEGRAARDRGAFYVRQQALAPEEVRPKGSPPNQSPGPYGYSPPQELARLHQEYEGALQRSGNFRTDVTGIVGRGYREAQRFAALQRGFKAILQMAKDTPEAAGVEHAIPVRATAQIPRDLREVIAAADRGELSERDLESLSQADLDALREHYFPDKSRIVNGRVQIDSPARKALNDLAVSMLTREQADAVMSITDARAEAWGAEHGLDPALWYDTHIAGTSREAPEGEHLAQLDEIQHFSEQKTAKNFRTKTNPRTQDSGRPMNPRIRRNGQHVVGPITPEAWVKRVTHVLPRAADRAAWAHWYSEVEPSMREVFGDDTDEILRGFAVSQANASPSTGLMAVLRVSRKIRLGEPISDKEISAVAPSIEKAVKGEPVEKGVAAKLSDFIDSIRNSPTRAWMGHRPEGGAPAAIDIHALRDLGYVDPRLVRRLEKMGLQSGKDFVTDTSGRAEGAMYERAAEQYAQITDHLNKIAFDGRRDWTPAQVQALGWAAIQKFHGVEPENLPVALDRNTRRVNLEVTKGIHEIGSDLTLEEGAQVAKDVEPSVRALVRDMKGLYMRSGIEHGISAYENEVNNSLHFDVLGSPEDTKALADRLANAYDQWEVWATRRSSTRGARPTLVLRSPAFIDEATKIKFWHALRQEAPDLVGFGPVFDKERPGLSIIIDKGKPLTPKTVDAFLDRYAGALEKAAHDTLPEDAEFTYEAQNTDITKGASSGEDQAGRASAGRAGEDHDHLAAEARDQLERSVAAVRARRAPAGEVNTLHQGEKGAVSFVDDGSAIIHAFKGADVSTFVHEVGHIMRRDLVGDDLKTVEAWAGVKEGNWTEAAEEKFARGFEQYLRDGAAPTSGLQRAFEAMRTWLRVVYAHARQLNVEVTPEIKDVFDRLLSGPGGPIKYVDERLLGGLNRSDAAGTVGQVFDTINAPFRAGTLYAKPAYAVNLLQNIGTSVIQQGVFAPANYRVALTLGKRLGKDDQHMIFSLMGDSLSRSFEADSGLGKATIDRAGEFWNAFVDRVPRVASFLHEARRAGFDTTPKLHALLHDESLRDTLMDIVDKANHEAIEYGHMTPFERNVLKRVFFFYPWLRGATIWSLRMPREHPIQAAAYAPLGRQGSDDERKALGRVISDLEGIVPVGGSKEHPYIVNPTSVNTFTTPIEVGHAIEGLTRGRSPFASAMAGELGPATSALYTLLSGKTTQGFDLPSGESRLHGALGSLASGVSPVVFQKRLEKKGGILHGGPQAAVTGFLAGSLGGDYYDKAAGQAQAEKEYVSTLDPEQKIHYKAGKAIAELPQQVAALRKKNVDIDEQTVAQVRNAYHLDAQRQLAYLEAAKKAGVSPKKLTASDKFRITIEVAEKDGALDKASARALLDALPHYRTDKTIQNVTSNLWSGVGLGSVKSWWENQMLTQLHPPVKKKPVTK